MDPLDGRRGEIDDAVETLVGHVGNGRGRDDIEQFVPSPSLDEFTAVELSLHFQRLEGLALGDDLLTSALGGTLLTWANLVESSRSAWTKGAKSGPKRTMGLLFELQTFSILS